MTITPGRGTKNLHLRQSTASVLELFGAPGKRRKASTLREYWMYPDQGVEMIVSRRSNHLLSIFIDLDRGFAGAELQGFTAHRIEDMFGRPSQQGGGIELGDGSYFNRWISYDSGIGFHFDRDGFLKTIVVFAPRRASRIKRAATVRASGSRAVAALRVP